MVCSREVDAESEILSGNVEMIVSDISIYGRSEGIDLIRRIRKIMPFTCPPIVVYTGVNPGSVDFSEAEKISDAVYEKGEISIMDLCARIRRIFMSGYSSHPS